MVGKHWKTKDRKLKAIVFEKKRAGCVLCGYKRCMAALDFHHVSKDKERSISKASTFAQLEREFSKCIVVCSNCHREIHASEASKSDQMAFEF